VTTRWQDVPMPPRIARLPQWGGMPVPWSAYRTAEGVPDFRVVDALKNLEMATRKLCTVCGVALGARVAFIGGPISIGNHTFFDGPMHRECAEYSSKVCPYLAMVRSYSLRPVDPEALAVMSEYSSSIPPERMAYAITRRWGTQQAKDGTLVYIAGEWLETVWFREPQEAK
jgi:hypothetical protein